MMAFAHTPRSIRALSALAALALAAGALVPLGSIEAQVRYRRPTDSGAGITAGYDTNGGAAGCADYECGGNCYDGHTGTDFGVPMDTPVVAAADGTVVTVVTGCPDIGYYCSPCGNLCGNQVRVRHSDGSETLYCHMRSGGMAVSEGATVRCGQRLGLSATSGCSTGAHVHFGYYPRGGWTSDDPFAGRCGGPLSLWTEQGAYGSIPGTACACVPATEVCNGRDDDCDGEVDEGEVCEVDLLHEQASAYAPPRTTDVDGDGRADVCARGGSGVRCWPSAGTSWRAEWAPVPLSDASGWNDVTNYATIRMGDVNGDGLADVCARSDAAFQCALSSGSGFGSFDVWRDGLSDANGWGNAQHYTTIRLADVNGDGRDDLCARDSQGFGCWLSNGTAFDRRVEGPRWSNAAGYSAARFYGTLRMADLNGDRRMDVCIRSAAGIECALASDDGFSTSIAGPSWSDAAGFGAVRFWSTLRVADLDGDRRDDLCIRTSADLRCVLSTGDGFGETVILGALSDANGWDDPSNYRTLRVGDVDGDGREELCARANASVTCWGWSGTAPFAVPGPGWSDESGWGIAQHYETMRMADFDGDGLDDLCARAAAGFVCHPSSGDGFGSGVLLDDLTNAGGWSEPRYWSTILIAGRACVPSAEVCNGLDDDCNGVIDDAGPEVCNGLDDDCDGEIDEGDVCAQDRDAGGHVGSDGGTIVPPGVDGGVRPPGSLQGSCGCRVAPRATPPGSLAALALAALALLGRRRGSLSR